MLDLSFINPFILGAVDAIKVQSGITVEPGEPFLKGKVPMPPINITSQLGLASRQFRGAISLCFEEQVFLKIMSGMLGDKITEINSETQDGASEILNIIYGFAKTALNTKGFNFDLAIPTVVRGKDLQTSHGRFPTLVIPLKTDVGQLFIEITVHQS